MKDNESEENDGTGRNMAHGPPVALVSTTCQCPLPMSNTHFAHTMETILPPFNLYENFLRGAVPTPVRPACRAFVHVDINSTMAACTLS